MVYALERVYCKALQTEKKVFFVLCKRTHMYYLIIIIMCIFKCYLSREHIALSFLKNGVNI